MPADRAILNEVCQCFFRFIRKLFQAGIHSRTFLQSCCQSALFPTILPIRKITYVMHMMTAYG